MPPSLRIPTRKNLLGESAHLELEFTARPGRLDAILSRQAQQVSRSRWQQLIREGCVRVAGIRVVKPALLLAGGELVQASIPAARPAGLAPVDLPLQVVFENEDLVLVNKPAGVVVHPSPGHESDTLVQAVLHHAPNLPGVGGERRPGVVHRLDRDTSGLIVFAKNERAMTDLQGQFKLRAVTKTYLAIVHGRPPTAQGLIDAPIGRDPRERKRMAVVPETRGRPARTIFRLRQSLGDFSLLSAEPETGRTHQIRVHLAYVGTPVAGDRVYGPRHRPAWIPRQMLHAWQLRLTLPGSTEARLFEADVPPDFRLVLARLQPGAHLTGEASSPDKETSG